MPQIRNLPGLAELLTKRPVEATLQFKKALELSGPENSWRNFVLYNLAAAQFDANQLDEMQQTMVSIQPETLDHDNRIKFHLLYARMYDKRGLSVEAARELLRAGKVIGSSQSRGSIVSQLQGSLQKIKGADTLEKLYRESEDSPFADLVLFRLAEEEMTVGNSAGAEHHLRELMSRYPDSSRYAAAADLVRAAQTSAHVDERAVGVLLPMRGKSAAVGENALQGIELAFKIFNHNEPDSKVKLIVQDSGEDPEQALKALNTLYFQYHVIAVIGPLLSKGIDQVTARAKELGLPLISLAQQPGQSSEYVFQAGLTSKLQTYEIARYAIQTLGLKNFAILFPQDRFGEVYAEEFWTAVESLGGKIVGAESYAPGETDFRQPVDKLSGLYYTEARQRELEALAKERVANNIKRRTRKTEHFFNLPPIVDYDAVFIPDLPRTLGQAIPTFGNRDVDHVRFLGIATWDSPELISRLQKDAENGYFVDAFFSRSNNPMVRKFVERYRASFGADPAVVQAMAYDAAAILDRILVSKSPGSRSELRDLLQEVSGFSGVTGKISFKDGYFSRDLKLLTVRSGEFVEATGIETPRPAE